MEVITSLCEKYVCETYFIRLLYNLQKQTIASIHIIMNVLMTDHLMDEAKYVL